MDPSELLRIVDTIHRDKNIAKEIVFEGIEAALVSAAKKHYGEEEDIQIVIDRTDGSIAGTHNGVPLAPEEMAERIPGAVLRIIPDAGHLPPLETPLAVNELLRGWLDDAL